MGYDLALVSLRDVVCVTSIGRSFILMKIRSIYAVRSFNSCGRGVYKPFASLARASEERTFLFLGKMTVLILGMCIAFNV